jgi:L-malate glycosyltransferase
MALRVLHVIGGGDTGGAMSHLLPLLSGLEKAGCLVHLLCLGEGGLADAARRRNIPVTALPMGGAHDARVMGGLRRLLVNGPQETAWRKVKSPWDVVHTHGMRANAPVRLVTLSLREKPCLFTTVHSDIRLDYGSRLLGRAYSTLDRTSLGRVDGIVCVSDSLRRLLIERGYPGERLVTVRSGLEMVAAPGGAAARAGSSGGRARLGTTTRVVAVKDIDLLLEVTSVVRRTHPQVEVVIMGDGPDRERSQARAAELGLGEAAVFTGRVEDVPDRLPHLDVFLITSVYEGGVSMSVLEAMAAGLPVVVTAAGGVEEAVVDGVTGYVVSRDQERGALAAALAERVAVLLDDPALRARMGAAGAARVRAEFTVERAAEQTLRAYERCLAARGR